MVQFSYLSFTSLFLIPFEFIILALLTLGVARKQVYFIISKTINFSFNINGMTIKLFPMFSVFSGIAMTMIYHELIDLQAQKDGHGHENGINQGEYEKILYHKFRNLLVHATNVFLVVQCWLAARGYESYMAAKLKFEDQKKAED